MVDISWQDVVVFAWLWCCILCQANLVWVTNVAHHVVRRTFLDKKLWYFFYSNFYNLFQFLVDLSTVTNFMDVAYNGLNGMWKSYVLLVNKMKQMDRHMSIVFVDVFVFIFMVIVIVLQIIMLLPFYIGLLLCYVFVYVMSFSVWSLIVLTMMIVDENFIWFWLLWLVFFIVHCPCVPCDCHNNPTREVHLSCLCYSSFVGSLDYPFLDWLDSSLGLVDYFIRVLIPKIMVMDKEN